jgi:RNA polymerase sigma-70 factor (ECF subfamily)
MSVNVTLDDEELLNRARLGDSTAYGQLIERYQERLYRAVRQIVYSPEDAADLCQDAFVNAFQSLSKYRGDSKFYTWLYRIAFNASVSFLRSKKPVLSLEGTRQEEGPALELADDSASNVPSSAIERDEKVADIRKAMNMLSPEHRLIVVLKEIEELPYEEIAVVLKIPVGTVRSRLHRAREELKTILERLEIEP